MQRVALYARYSSDNQRETSIEDQFRICRTRAKQEHWTIEHTFLDAAISGSSIIQRPGIQALIRDAYAGHFNLVMAEALDRISRDQADVATLYKQLQFLGIKIFTLAEGEITELHVGLKGTMNALMLKDLAQKTHRGLRGRVEQGKSGGGISYGYRAIQTIIHHGQVLRGDREIIEEEAVVIERIFQAFAHGASPLSIARQLNKDNIPGPGGKDWNDSTIRGHVKRGTGILNNELYIGRLVWNRQRYIKDPVSGKRVSRLNPETDWVVSEVPELRIIDDALWQSVRIRQTEIAADYFNVTAAIQNYHRQNKLNPTRRPKSLLSGKVYCGLCKGPYSLRGADRFVCSNHIGKATCHNSRTISREHLEQRALNGLQHKIMAPEHVEEALLSYTAGVQIQQADYRAKSIVWAKELTNVENQITQLVHAITDGMYHPSMKVKLTELETQKATLIAHLSDKNMSQANIRPNAIPLYQEHITNSIEAFHSDDQNQVAKDQIRALIEKIELVPATERGKVHAHLKSELVTILDWTERQAVGKTTKNKTPGGDLTGVSVSVVAGAGFEPAAFRL